MRLFKHPNGTYYIAISRGNVRSLKTKNKALATELFKEIQREHILKRFNITVAKNISLKEFENEKNESGELFEHFMKTDFTKNIELPTRTH